MITAVIAKGLTLPGSRLNIKTVFPGYGIPKFKIRRSQDRLIFKMGINILVSRHLYIETAPRCRDMFEYTDDQFRFVLYCTCTDRREMLPIEVSFVEEIIL